MRQDEMKLAAAEIANKLVDEEYREALWFGAMMDAARGEAGSLTDDADEIDAIAVMAVKQAELLSIELIGPIEW